VFEEALAPTYRLAAVSPDLFPGREPAVSNLVPPLGRDAKMVMKFSVCPTANFYSYAMPPFVRSLSMLGNHMCL
jgi:hypothetical protein